MMGFDIQKIRQNWCLWLIIWSIAQRRVLKEQNHSSAVQKRKNDDNLFISNGCESKKNYDV